MILFFDGSNFYLYPVKNSVYVIVHDGMLNGISPIMCHAIDKDQIEGERKLFWRKRIYDSSDFEYREIGFISEAIIDRCLNKKAQYAFFNEGLGIYRCGNDLFNARVWPIPTNGVKIDDPKLQHFKHAVDFF